MDEFNIPDDFINNGAETAVQDCDLVVEIYDDEVNDPDYEEKDLKETDDDNDICEVHDENEQLENSEVNIPVNDEYKQLEKGGANILDDYVGNGMTG